LEIAATSSNVQLILLSLAIARATGLRMRNAGKIGCAIDADVGRALKSTLTPIISDLQP
jgi:hypothetical protein